MSYLQKRAHLSALALGRKMFAEIPKMTPARFDVLHILYEQMRSWPPSASDPMMLQANVRRRLGLRRQTVWKMIQRLVELGLVHKEYYRRHVLLGLTRKGIDLIEEAYGAAFTESYPVPKQSDGSAAPRHVKRLAREQALVEELYVDAFARLKLPPDPHNLWWGPVPTRPKKVGREVGRVFTTLAWQRAGGPNHELRIDALDKMLREVHTVARALGDESELIYPVPRSLSGGENEGTIARRPRRLRRSRYPLTFDEDPAATASGQ